MIVGVLKEADFENRVSLLPEGVKSLGNLKSSVLFEKGSGSRAFATDDEYKSAGAEEADIENILKRSNIILSINAPSREVLSKLPESTIIISVFNPLAEKETIDFLLDKKITAFSMDMIPRTTRGQAMDVLSSMATIAGYKAVLDAAFNLPNFMPMFMTAAGTIRPAKVLILGAGVAGLQAIAIARKLGAVVEVFDVRSAVKEQVESLGGKFVEVEGATEDAAAGGYAVEQTDEFKQKQKQLIHDHAAKSSILICTAQIPGRAAPLLIEKHTVEAMKAGSVIIDLAASTGGNCELTENGKTVVKEGVKIIGKSDYPSDMPNDASRMYGNNLINLLKVLLDDEGNINLNLEDEILQGTCITHAGEIISPRLKSIYSTK
ncbi:MAG: Re/Si-specific NAD(P)(+) transhydrogenase subunit alpha [Chlorobi bacterium]|nr:Re/Si-specific NAD(P)(+) transhydrogenase subunit alpha [Chlorobiota bacterium]